MPPRKDIDDESSAEQSIQEPVSTFSVYLDEGNKLFRMFEYRKAIDSYTNALEQQPNDKLCLTSRAKCYLQLGESESALIDAETALEEDENYISGLYVKAEALYTMGDFEYALMYFHTGHNARPEQSEFRLGIQKSQEAIENSIGVKSTAELSTDCNLSLFHNRELTKNYITFQERRKKQKAKPGGTQSLRKREEQKKKDEQKRGKKVDPRTSRRLLGELYPDKKFFEELFQDEGMCNDSESGSIIKNYTVDALNYLSTRSDFWRQQDPRNAQPKEANDSSKSQQSREMPSDPTQYLLGKLEDLEELLCEEKGRKACKMAKNLLNEVNGWKDVDYAQKYTLIANIYNVYAIALIDVENYDEALIQTQNSIEIAEKHELEDVKSKALDNLGKIMVKQKRYDEAVHHFKDKISLIKDTLEKTWIYHEIGRCYLELKDYSESREWAMKSVESSKECEDDQWELNAHILLAHSLFKLDECPAAIEEFKLALTIAELKKDKDSCDSIKDAINDVNDRIVKGLKPEDDPHTSRSSSRAKSRSPSPKQSGRSRSRSHSRSPHGKGHRSRSHSPKSHRSRSRSGSPKGSKGRGRSRSPKRKGSKSE